MKTVACAYEFCDLKHETGVACHESCTCTICKTSPLHHPDCCADHFREQHRGKVACAPVPQPKRGLFGRASKAPSSAVGGR
jgi:hypothetical protein